MRYTTLFTTLAAAALALGVTACDEQQAGNQSTEPMQQQQGAVPPAPDSGGSMSPTAPQGTESPSMTPPAEDPSTSQPGTGGTGQ